MADLNSVIVPDERLYPCSLQMLHSYSTCRFDASSSLLVTR